MPKFYFKTADTHNEKFPAPQTRYYRVYYIRLHPRLSEKQEKPF